MQTRLIMWAMLYTRTHQSRVSQQGSGSSTQLSEPEPTETIFHFRARWPEPIGADNITGSRNSYSSLKFLAGNLATNYHRFPMSSEEPVLFDNGPDDEEIKLASRIGDGVAEVRPLTFGELAVFMATFQEVNAESALTG